MTPAANAHLPNFFLVGVPKAATTSMHAWLGQHPDIFMSRMKEPQFFAEDVLGHQRNITVLEDYLGRFAAADGKRVIGESSTSYMVSRTAARRIKDFNPNARILVMLRHPVDVMYALNSERVYSGMEHNRDFSAAIDSSETRVWQRGRWKGEAIIRPSYRDVATLAPQLKRYFDVFNREQIHVILHSNLFERPAETWNALQAFLCVSPLDEGRLPHENANRRVRHMHLQNWLRLPPSPIRAFAHTVLPIQRRRKLGEWLRGLNTIPEPRVPLDERLREKLIQECASDIADVSRLIEQDLSAWLVRSEASGYSSYSFMHTSKSRQL